MTEVTEADRRTVYAVVEKHGWGEPTWEQFDMLVDAIALALAETRDEARAENARLNEGWKDCQEKNRRSSEAIEKNGNRIAELEDEETALNEENRELRLDEERMKHRIADLEKTVRIEQDARAKRIAPPTDETDKPTQCPDPTS